MSIIKAVGKSVRKMPFKICPMNMSVGKMFHENGTLMYEGDMKNGERHGNGKMYYENGTLMYEGDMKNGLPYGSGKTYRENGTLIYEGKMENGLPY